MLNHTAWNKMKKFRVHKPNAKVVGHVRRFMSCTHKGIPGVYVHGFKLCLNPKPYNLFHAWTCTLNLHSQTLNSKLRALQA